MTIASSPESLVVGEQVPMTVKVVVGVDGSAPSVHALDWALAEAARRHADCEVVSASEGWAMAAGDLAAGDLAAGDWIACRQRAVGEFVEAARERTGLRQVAVNIAVVPGHPALVLSAAAAEAALLVVGTRARAAATEALFGSVSEECLARSSSPVVVVPPDARTATTFGRFVVGVDGSAPSRAALTWAVDEARIRDAELVLVHVWHIPAAPANPYAAVDSAVFRDAGAEILAGALGDVEGVVPRVSSRLVLGRAARSLCDEAARADLIVVGGRGRGPVAGALLGSVGQGCARHGPCPVVVVREGGGD